MLDHRTPCKFSTFCCILSVGPLLIPRTLKHVIFTFIKSKSESIRFIACCGIHGINTSSATLQVCVFDFRGATEVRWHW